MQTDTRETPVLSHCRQRLLNTFLQSPDLLFNSFCFTCPFSLWWTCFVHLDTWFWHKSFSCFTSLRNLCVLPSSAGLRVLVMAPAMLTPLPGTTSGIPQKQSLPLEGGNQTSPKRKYYDQLSAVFNTFFLVAARLNVAQRVD